MSLSALNYVRAALDTETLLAGYAVKYFRWTDADLQGDGEFVMLRLTGSGGGSNVIEQQKDVTLSLVGTETTVVASDARMKQIERFFREPVSDNGAHRFDPIGAVQGPFYLENGRPVFSLVIRVSTEDE